VSEKRTATLLAITAGENGERDYCYALNPPSGLLENVEVRVRWGSTQIWEGNGLRRIICYNRLNSVLEPYEVLSAWGSYEETSLSRVQRRLGATRGPERAPAELPLELAGLWPLLSDETRLVAGVLAEEIAQRVARATRGADPEDRDDRDDDDDKDDDDDTARPADVQRAILATLERIEAKL